VRSRSRHCRSVSPCGRRWWPSPQQFVAELAASALRSYAVGAASSRVGASCLRHRSEAQPGGGADPRVRSFYLACVVAAGPSPCTLGLMTLASVLCASAESAKPVATAGVGNRTSGGGRPRTALRLLDRRPAPPAVASPLASSRCAITPGIAAPSLHAVAAGGRRRSNSSPGLRLQRSGRTLLVKHRPECRPSARITALGPNPALNRTWRCVPSTWHAPVAPRRLAFRWAS